MKNFIKALEDKGIMNILVNSAILTEKITGIPVAQNGLEMILEHKFKEDEDLEDMFLQEAHGIAMKSVFKYVQKQIEERQKVEALNDVDFDTLFKKAFGQESSKKNVQEKSLDDEIEERLLESMSKAFSNALEDIVKDMFKDCK
jgi:hypothetical protein